MSDIRDEHTYCCDECGVPVVLSNLIPVGKEHWCRPCYDRAHNTGRSTHRREGNELARGSTVFEDWP